MTTESVATASTSLRKFARVEGLLAKVFADQGVQTVGDLAALNANEFREIRGIGKQKLAYIESLIEQARDTLGPDQIERTAETVEPDGLSELLWRAIPMEFPKRAVTFLDKYELRTIGQLRRLLNTGMFLDPGSGEQRSVYDEPNFSEGSLDSVRVELQRLLELGLNRYRYGSEKAPETASEVARQVENALSAEEWEFLSAKCDGEHVSDIGAKRGMSRQTAKNRFDALMKKTWRWKDACEAILVPFVEQLLEAGGVPLDECVSITGADAPSEFALLLLISDTPHRLDENKWIRLLTITQEKVIHSRLAEAIESSIPIVQNGRVDLLALPETTSEDQTQVANAVRNLRRLGVETVKLSFLTGAIGTKWLAIPMRKMLVASKINGLSRAELDPNGMFSSDEELQRFLGEEAELQPNGRFRRPGATNAKIDDVVALLRSSPNAMRADEILAALEWDLQKEFLLSRYLTPSREIIAADVGLYTHASKLSLTADRVDEIMNWGAALVAGETESIEASELFELYQEEFGNDTLTHWYQILSIVSKSSSVQRICNTSRLACRTHFDETELFLAETHPELAAQWCYEKNGDLTPETIRSASSQEVWWECEKGHVFQRPPVYRTTASAVCPGCKQHWTLEKLRFFVESLQPHLDSLTPAEIYAIAQQNGLANSDGQGNEIVKKLMTGNLPKEEVEQFVDREHPNEDDAGVGDTVAPTDEAVEANDLIGECGSFDGGEGSEQSDLSEAMQLPEVRTEKALDAIDEVERQLGPSVDAETAEFLVASAKAKLWSNAYREEEQTVLQARQPREGAYSRIATTEFLAEYESAKALVVPHGYSFTVDGETKLPNLMQRRVAVDARDRKRVGNWSGTGAGKTLSAILSTRVVDAKLTVICCPNAVVGSHTAGWAHEIRRVFPESEVQTKTLSPRWIGASDHRYLVLNYEQFQQPESESKLKQLVDQSEIDFVVIDEVHYAKQRHLESVSKRRRLIQGMLSLASAKNPDLRVLALSATPVINNLQEGKSLVEMITGLEHKELKTRSTVSNCMQLHQKITTLGTRWRPNYSAALRLQTPECDCSESVSEIRALGSRPSPLDVEKILTRFRLPLILERLSPSNPTLVYTHYVDGIDQMLAEAIGKAGYRVGFHTGQTKGGLEAFKAGQVDVLIGSSAIGTGVDGLQLCCNQLIVNSLPWTNAEFEQLIGRVWRQGQRSEQVDVIIPVTFANVAGQRWSYCDSKLQRIRFKRSIADAVVDGVVPEGKLRSVDQAQQDVMQWLQRLEEGQVIDANRRRLQSDLRE